MNVQIAATRIGELLTGQVLWDVDQALDDARKIVYVATFENCTGGHAADAMGVSSLARSIARELEDLCFDDALAVVRRVRFIFWRVRYEERRSDSGAPWPGDAGAEPLLH